MNKLEQLRCAVNFETDDTIAYWARELLSDPDNAVVVVPRLRDADGRARCCIPKTGDGCRMFHDRGYFSCAACRHEKVGDDYVPLPYCPVWDRCDRGEG